MSHLSSTKNLFRACYFGSGVDTNRNVPVGTGHTIKSSWRVQRPVRSVAGFARYCFAPCANNDARPLGRSPSMGCYNTAANTTDPVCLKPSVQCASKSNRFGPILRSSVVLYLWGTYASSLSTRHTLARKAGRASGPPVNFSVTGRCQQKRPTHVLLSPSSAF
eukprot:144790-Prorocentrum_minimum.AAC.2